MDTALLHSYELGGPGAIVAPKMSDFKKQTFKLL